MSSRGAIFPAAGRAGAQIADTVLFGAAHINIESFGQQASFISGLGYAVESHVRRIFICFGVSLSGHGWSLNAGP